MSIITLITDFGNKDHFVGKIKGDIYSNYNEAKIVDISNNVSPFNIMEAAYIGRSSIQLKQTLPICCQFHPDLFLPCS